MGGEGPQHRLARAAQAQGQRDERAQAPRPAGGGRGARGPSGCPPEAGGGEGGDRGGPALAPHFQRDPGAEAVAGDVRALDPELVAAGPDRGGEVGGARLDPVGQRRRRAEARHVEHDHLALGLEQADDRLPDDAAAAEAVQEEERRALGAARAQRHLRLREERLQVADPPLAEAGLRGAQVEGPEPAEALVVAARAQPLPGAEEALAPGGEGERVVGGDVLRPDLAQLGVAGDAGGDQLLGGQAAAGEDVGVGEAAGALLDLVEVVVDRDRLQQHQAVGG